LIAKAWPNASGEDPLRFQAQELETCKWGTAYTGWGEFQRDFAACKRKKPPKTGAFAKLAWIGLVVIRVPIALRMPAIVFGAPVSVIAVPAMLALVIQFPATLFSLRTMFAVLLDGIVEPMLGFFDVVLTLGVVVVSAGHGRGRRQHQPGKRKRGKKCFRNTSNLSQPVH
jgi:hypothetical protein